MIKADDSRGLVKGKPPAPGTEDAYLERLLKLIPAETIAMHLFIQGILQSALASPKQRSQLQVWLWAVFAILIVGNIFFLQRFLSVKDPIQYVILTLAFIVWVLTLGGPFEFLGFYQPFMGSVILGFFMFFVPIFYDGVTVS